MGYYTRYKLELQNVSTPKGKEEVLMEALAKCSSDEERIQVFNEVESSYKLVDEEEIISQLREYNDDAAYALDEDGSTYEQSKWYSWQEDMREFSKQFPEVLFVLSGEGEESGDIWKAYIKNGKMQIERVTITFDEYDPSKLA